MRIGFDARILTVPKCGGVVYFSRLLQYLPTMDDTLELVLFLPSKILAEYETLLFCKRISCVVVPGGADDLSRWPAACMPRLLKEHHIDLFHQPFNADGPFFFAPCPVVISVLDLIPWVVPGIFRKLFKAWRYKARNMIWAHTSAHILTISEVSRRDIIRLCRVPSSKVTVTLLGADDIYIDTLTTAQEDEILFRLGLERKKYIVNMGGFNQSRRNPDFILEGFARYIRETGDDRYLVVTGSVLQQNDFRERIEKKKADEGISKRVIVTGFLSNKELKVVLSRADVSVITSLYEGFCLPLVESFVCGVPSIANDRGSIPEIAGDAALLVDPDRPDLLVLRLKEILSDRSFAELLRKKGYEQAKRFDWRDMAARTLEVYRAQMAGGR